MDSDFSEFSYGYAAIREAEAGISLIYKMAGAPKLPSLVEEEELGYDVRLAFVGYALFLQFKRSVFVSRKRTGSPTWPGVGTKHYRYSIDTSGHQHRALLDLEAQLLAAPGTGEVFYAAPIFYKQSDFNRAYADGGILERSSLVVPSDLGDDDGVHHLVATAPGAATVMSDPRPAERSVTWEGIREFVRANVSSPQYTSNNPRLTVGDLEGALDRSVAKLGAGARANDDPSVVSRLHRSAALLGCGLALVVVEPSQ